MAEESLFIKITILYFMKRSINDICKTMVLSLKQREKKNQYRTPEGLVIILRPPYSFVLDEIFLMKVYGQPQPKGASCNRYSVHHSVIQRFTLRGWGHQMYTALKQIKIYIGWHRRTYL